MNEHASGSTDPERLAVAGGRFETFIVEGITRAHLAGTEIDRGTARLIGHVLGRALGVDSQLADFGRTGAGDYEGLRDEYLQLYNYGSTPPMVKEWIDWLGTYLVAERGGASGRRFMSENTAPSLERILVPTRIVVGEMAIRAYAPASLSAAAIVNLGERLETGPHISDSGFRAFLTLSDVNAAAENLDESFDETYVGAFATIADAVRNLVELAEWEEELRVFGRERGIEEAISIDLDVIEARTREIYDLVEWEGNVHAFHK